MYWTEGIVSCDCDSCLVLTDATMKLNRERLHVLTILTSWPRGVEVEKLVMINMKRNERVIKQEFAWETRRKTDSKLFFNTSKDVKFIVFRNLISFVKSNFASTWTKLHKKTAHTSLPGTKLRKGVEIMFKQSRTSRTNEVKTRLFRNTRKNSWN